MSVVAETSPTTTTTTTMENDDDGEEAENCCYRTEPERAEGINQSKR